ncbi:MAG: type IV pilus secretin PilQ [Holophagaceae bacterium]|nr:type IV pilus secretin PilQ [Holophagaceae bacterium]
MNARLISWLVAGSIVFVSGQHGFLCGSPPAPDFINNGLPSVVAAKLESSLDSARVSLHVPGFTGKPVIQVLESGNRLVVDLKGVNRGNTPRAEILNLAQSPLINAARLAQNQPEPKSVTRLVLELVPGTKAVVSSEPHGVDISLTKGSGKTQASLRDDYHGITQRLTNTTNTAASPVIMAASIPEPNLPSLQIAADSAPAINNDEWEALSFSNFDRLPQIGSPYIGLPSLGSMPVTPIVTANVLSPNTTVAPRYPNQQMARYAAESETRKYTGEPITLDHQNADLATIIKILAQNSPLSLVMDPDVNSPGWNYYFKDMPWDEILDNVVLNAGLAMEVSNNVIRIAKVEKLKKEADDRADMERSKALAGELVTVTRGLSYAKADQVSKVLANVKSDRGKIYTDDRTNLIIMSDLPKYIDIMQRMMDQLDIKVPQVQIEARIVEANKGWEKAFGTSWPTSNAGSTQIENVGNWGSYGGPSWNSINGGPGNSSSALAFSPGKPGATDIVGASGELWVSFLTNRLSFNAIIQALESTNQIKVVSQPKLSAPNNEQAYISDGSRIPYQSNQGGAAGGAITVQFVEAQLKLQVKPQITNDGNILMEVELEKGQPDFGNQVNGTPTILTKQLKTTIFVHDGGTAVLGGVFSNSLETGSTGVPFLSKLPGIGWMFRNKTSHDKTTEMLVMISPKILEY